ncbi:MAG: isoprenylcysteine carboxylmethyltransferase family protein [Fimbriimonadaceae bacterium]|nr:isoprenylcysteine carboxylmethyltransferase family protein [Fimbriimonadaceae bacterium]
MTLVRRGYFLCQALACFFWWSLVFADEGVRRATLGGLSPDRWFVPDLALFGGLSLTTAALPSRSLGLRIVLVLLLAWSGLVTAVLMVHALLTNMAGLGVVLMACATSGTLLCGLPLAYDPVWVGRLLPMPLRVRPAERAPEAWKNVAKTILQILVFWSLLLWFVPLGIRILEERWGLGVPALRPSGVALAGWVLFAVMGSVGIWAGMTMATLGKGTPLPSSAANLLVIAGPYRFVRNPMAITGISQGIASGLILGSWMVVLYAVAGSAVWNCLVRPYEEADLSKRFGREFEVYRQQVRCWIPGRLFTGTADHPVGGTHRG